MKFLSLILVFISTFLVSCRTNKAYDFVEKETLAKYLEEDTFLKIIGTEPFWNISVSDKQLLYTSLNNNDILFDRIVTSETSENTKIIGKNKTHQIQLTISEKECSDGMSDTVFFYEAQWIINQDNRIISSGKGCAEFMLHPN